MVARFPPPEAHEPIAAREGETGHAYEVAWGATVG